MRFKLIIASVVLALAAAFAPAAPASAGLPLPPPLPALLSPITSLLCNTVTQLRKLVKDPELLAAILKQVDVLLRKGVCPKLGDVLPRLTKSAAEQDAARLRADSRVPAEIRVEDGVLHALEVEIPGGPGDLVDVGKRFLNRYPALFRIGPATQLIVDQVDTDAGYVRFVPKLRGLPAPHSDVVVVVGDDNLVRGVIGRFLLDDAGFDPTPRVTEEEAQRIVLGQRGSTGRIVGVTRLVAADPTEPGIAAPGPARAAWQVSDGRTAYLIDALTGAIVFRDDGVRELHNSSFWDIRNMGDGDSTGCWDDPAAAFLGSTALLGVIPGSPLDAFAVEDALDDTTGYLATVGWDNWDGDGGHQAAYINSTTGGRASYSHACDTIEFNTDLTPPEIVAHEVMHGVNRRTAALAYRNTSGALNESFSDILGAVISGNDDWTHTRRSLADPLVYKNPDRVGGDFYVTPVSNPDKEENDNGGVHVNSGIQNKVWHSLAEGRAAEPTELIHEVSGVLDRRTAGRVALYANRVLIRDSSWSMARTAWKLALHQVLNELSADEALLAACDVKNAWANANVGKWEFDDDCDGRYDDLDLVDRDGDLIPNGEDNCNNDYNPFQEDADRDGIGDFCESGPLDDADDDGVPNGVDNCPLRVNPGQEDSGGDPFLGDACEDPFDFDDDGVRTSSDNCPTVKNYNQDDRDGDGVGDACDDDTDGDGAPNSDDNCLWDPNPDQLDSDGGGVGDVCDIAPFSILQPASENPVLDNFLDTVEVATPAGGRRQFQLAVLGVCAGGCPEDRRDSGRPVELLIRGLPIGAKVAIVDEFGHAVHGGYSTVAMSDNGQVQPRIAIPQGLHRYAIAVQVPVMTSPTTISATLRNTGGPVVVG